MPDGVAGGVSARVLSPGNSPQQYPDLLSAATTIMQSGGGGYARLINALQSLDQAQNIFTLASQAANFASEITALQAQVATLQGQVTTLQGQVAALGLFQASFSYRQLEVSTNTVYLNGSTIYRRSFVMPATMLATPNQVGTYAHGVANMGYIVTIEAIASLYQGQALPITFLQTAQVPMVNGLSCWGDPTNIYISVGNTAFPTYTPIATMWYTATDR